MAQALEFGGDHAIAPGWMFQGQFPDQVYQPLGIFTRDIVEGASGDREALEISSSFSARRRLRRAFSSSRALRRLASEAEKPRYF